MKADKKSSKFRDRSDLELCEEFQKTADTEIWETMLNRYQPCLSSQAREAVSRTKDFSLIAMDFEDFLQEFKLDLHQTMLKVKPHLIKCDPKYFKFSVPLKTECRNRVRNLLRTASSRSERCGNNYIDPSVIMNLSEETQSCYFGSFCLLTDGERKFYIPSIDIRNSAYEFTEDEDDFVYHRP